MFAQSNKSTATLPIFSKLSSDLFEKSGIALEFFGNFWGLITLARPRASRNLKVRTSAMTYLTDPRTGVEHSNALAVPSLVITPEAAVERHSVLAPESLSVPSF